LAACAVYAPLTKTAAPLTPHKNAPWGTYRELQPERGRNGMRRLQGNPTAEYKDRPSETGTKDPLGHWRIEPAELHAVYPYLYVVELAVDTDKLNVELNRRMLHFHKSRNIRVRHGRIHKSRNIQVRRGRRIIRETQIYFRWCFSDSATARAFIEQFGGELNI